MKNRFAFVLIALAALAGCQSYDGGASLDVRAKTIIGSPPANYAKWAGAWKRPANFFWGFDPSVRPPARQPAPYKDEYMKIYNDSAALRAANGEAGGAKQSNCEPGGMPEVMNMVYLMELLPQPHQLIVVSEYQSFIRRIHMDGRGHESKAPTYAGDSTAYWDGDSLVVDTVGLRPNLLFASMRHPKITVTERMRLVDDDTWEDVMTVHSPLFSHPWTVTKRWVRESGDINEYVCEENERNPIDEDGKTGFVAK